MAEYNDGAMNITVNKVEDVVTVSYKMYSWHLLAHQRDGSKEVQVDGYCGLSHVKESEVDAEVLSDMLHWLADLRELKEDQDYIIANNGVKIRLWTLNGGMEAVATEFNIKEAFRILDKKFD